jgi:hypothetical protein
MHELVTEVLTRADLTLYEQKLAAVKVVVDACPALSPHLYGTYEPLKLRFHPAEIDTFVAEWQNGLSGSIYWKTRSPEIEGGFSANSFDEAIHGWLTLWSDRNDVDYKCFVRCMLKGADLSCADFAFTHVVVESDIRANAGTRCYFRLDPKRDKWALHTFTHDLRRYIPELYWGSVFGLPYIAMFGRKRLLSAPAPVVEELSYGGIYLQLSDDPFDLLSDYEDVNAVRGAVKSHLGGNAFYDKELPEDHQYDVPSFEHLSREA